MAVATYVPAGLLALLWVFYERLVTPLALLAAVCAVVTLYTTGMIYASLRTIRHWYQPLTAPLYIVLGLASGGVLFNALLHGFGQASAFAAWLAIALLALGAMLKVSYWQAVDTGEKRYTAEMALGLGHIGKVRPLEPPHTQPNFVMREMGYTIARKHAEKLRTLVLVLAFAAPIAAMLLTLIPAPVTGLAGSVFAVLAMTVGLIVERWLFFAEAEHVSMLYYGAEAA
jgi:DMSO reductase anchor subunit